MSQPISVQDIMSVFEDAMAKHVENEHSVKHRVIYLNVLL